MLNSVVIGYMCAEDTAVGIVSPLPAAQWWAILQMAPLCLKLALLMISLMREAVEVRVSDILYVYPAVHGSGKAVQIHTWHCL